MQTGQDLGVTVVIQTDTADQKLLVYLTHHRAGTPGLTLRHGRGHLTPQTMTADNLQGDKDKVMNICQYFGNKSVTFRVLKLSKLITGGTRS